MTLVWFDSVTLPVPGTPVTYDYDGRFDSPLLSSGEAYDVQGEFAANPPGAATVQSAGTVGVMKFGLEVVGSLVGVPSFAGAPPARKLGVLTVFTGAYVVERLFVQYPFQRVGPYTFRDPLITPDTSEPNAAQDFLNSTPTWSIFTAQCVPPYPPASLLTWFSEFGLQLNIVGRIIIAPTRETFAGGPQIRSVGPNSL